MVIYSFTDYRILNDFGTKIQIQCHQPIQRLNINIDGQKCSNWAKLDRMAVRQKQEQINEKLFDTIQNKASLHMQGNDLQNSSFKITIKIAHKTELEYIGV